MKYFFLETDEGNKIPYAINKNRAIDIRYLTKEGLSRLPMWTIVRMVFSGGRIFPGYSLSALPVSFRDLLRGSYDV